MAKKNSEMSYSDAMSEVNEILEKLNNEQLDIDLLSVEVKRATELLALCKTKLRKTEEEITKLFDQKNIIK